MNSHMHEVYETNVIVKIRYLKLPRNNDMCHTDFK